MITNVINILLIALLLLGSIEDIRTRKIPNRYTGPAILAGLILMTVANRWPGLQDSLLGFALAFAVFFLPFAFGAVGAGDLKFMAAIGALKGFAFTAKALLASALAGGVVALAYLIWKRKLLASFLTILGYAIAPLARYLHLHGGYRTAGRVAAYFESRKEQQEKIYIPYAVPISIGTLLVLTGLFDHILPW